jgi:membrane-associated phospholipid phosphatase
MKRGAGRDPGACDARRRRALGARLALPLVAALVATAAVAAQDGPLRAALAALERPDALPAGSHDLPVAPRTLCEPLRCGFVWPADDVPVRSRRGTVALGAALGAGLGAALGHEREPGPRPALEPFGWGDGAVIAAAALAWRLHGFAHHEPAESERGRFSDCVEHTDALNGVDRFWRRTLAGGPAESVAELRASQRRRERFDHVSDLTLHATWAQPLAFLAAGGAPDQWRDVLVYVEAAAVAAALTEIGKHTFHRPRPFAHFCEPLDASALGGGDARLSFFSGHTALAFATASAGWRLAQMRGYRHAGRLKGSGLALAAATGVLRLAADKHYFTDVLVGAAVGWGTGFVVTRLARRAASEVDSGPAIERGGTARTLGDDGYAAAAAARAALAPAGGMTFGLPRGGLLVLGFAAGGPAFALHGRF